MHTYVMYLYKNISTTCAKGCITGPEFVDAQVFARGTKVSETLGVPLPPCCCHGWRVSMKYRRICPWASINGLVASVWCGFYDWVKMIELDGSLSSGLPNFRLVNSCNRHVRHVENPGNPCPSMYRAWPRQKVLQEAQTELATISTDGPSAKEKLVIQGEVARIGVWKLRKRISKNDNSIGETEEN